MGSAPLWPLRGLGSVFLGNWLGPCDVAFPDGGNISTGGMTSSSAVSVYFCGLNVYCKVHKFFLNPEVTREIEHDKGTTVLYSPLSACNPVGKGFRPEGRTRLG